jgi:hypothetical protein
MRVRPEPSQIAEIYIDESSQNNHRFLVLGGVIVSLLESPRLQQLIMKARLPDLPDKEAKWTKVSRAKLAAYKRVVDVLFDNPDLVHFHALCVDTTRLDHRRFNQGSREIGFNKEIYQLAIKFSRLYGTNLFHVYPDRRETNQKPEELRIILTRGCRKNGDKRDWPFRRCQFRESRKTLALQLVDILIGALAFRKNEHDRAAGASPAKTELSRYILERARITDITHRAVWALHTMASAIALKRRLAALDLPATALSGSTA